jgi:hypothetical protein
MMYAFRSTLAVTAAFILASLTPAPAASGVATGAFAGCPVQGSGGDPQLNELKNRSASPPSANPITLAGMKRLPMPPAATPAMRADWPASTRAMITSHEGEGVVFTGYIVSVAREAADTSNCSSALPSNEDIELFLADRPGVSDSKHIILAEITPRWRAVYTSWRAANLRKVSTAGNRVRITGWLIYDQESWRERDHATATPWEIEPITNIAVLRNGNWANF